eukprot:scaffold72241_cov28-Tisochrysis_lutea.AAC.2
MIMRDANRDCRLQIAIASLRAPQCQNGHAHATLTRPRTPQKTSSACWRNATEMTWGLAWESSMRGTCTTRR